MIACVDGEWHEVLFCRDCGREWQRPIRPGRKPLRCPTCAEPAPHVCEACAEPVIQHGPGRHRRWCAECYAECSAEAARERARAWRRRRMES